MRFHCSLKLPRDSRTLPIARHFCESVLNDLGVRKECTESISYAFNEACANVIQHSAADDDFEVGFEVNADSCVVRVVDHGGFDIDRVKAFGEVDPLAEHGRGVGIIHRLMDRVTYAHDENGTSIQLEKQLHFDTEPVVGLR